MAEIENAVETTEVQEAVETEQTEVVDVNAELKRLQKALADQIKKNDTLAKENKDQKAQIRASKTAEEQKAEVSRYVLP